MEGNGGELCRTKSLKPVYIPVYNRYNKPVKKSYCVRCCVYSVIFSLYLMVKITLPRLAVNHKITVPTHIIIYDILYNNMMLLL